MNAPTPHPTKPAESHWPADEHVPLLDVTIGEALRRVAEATPDRLALVDGAPDGAGPPRTWTYRELLGAAERAATALLGRFRPGERVGVWSPNCPEWVILQHGAALAGLTLVTLNPAYRRQELEYVLGHSRVAGVFFADEYRGTRLQDTVAAAARAVPELRESLPLSEWEAFVATGDPAVQLPAVASRDPANLQYTSGTTGFPKGVLIHHLGMVSSARLVAERTGLEDGCVWINAMPMFHVGACGIACLGTVARGGTHVILPGFDAGLLLERVERHRGTIALGVPTMLIALLEHPDLPRRDVSSLRTVMSGGSPVPADLVRRVRETLGVRFTITFGQTEASGVTTQTDPDGPVEEQARTVGRPLPHVELKIADPDTGAVLPLGAEGEICTRGPQNMIGYFEAPEATAQAVDPDGWLHYGDLGSMDEDGLVRVVGRLKDMIIRGGENISPVEVESALFEDDAVGDVAVVGVPDERWGERIAAVVRPADPEHPPLPADLRARCRMRLASHKTPVEWYVVDELPMTASGKIQKFRLRQLITTGALSPAPTEESS